MKNLLSLEDVAECLGMSPSDTEKILDRGRLRPRIIAGEKRYLLDEVLHQLEQEFDSLTIEKLRGVDLANVSQSGMGPKDHFIKHLLPPHRIHPFVKANTASSMIRSLADLACETGRVFDRNALVDQIRAREEKGSTALANGVAFPHPLDVRKVYHEDRLLLLARTPHGIPFGGPKGRLSSLFFLLFFPGPANHLHVLARLTRMIRKQEFIESLLSAEDEVDMHGLIDGRETELLEEHAESLAG